MLTTNPIANKAHDVFKPDASLAPNPEIEEVSPENGPLIEGIPVNTGPTVVVIGACPADDTIA